MLCEQSDRGGGGNLNKITIFKRSDGKEIPVKKQILESRLLPAKCFKTKVGILIELVRDEKGWCWYSTLNNGLGHGLESAYTTEEIVLNGVQRTKGNFACAGCGAKKFVRCKVCRRLTCWNGEGVWNCAFCGNMGYPSGTIKSVGALSKGDK